MGRTALTAALVDVGGTIWPETSWPSWQTTLAGRVERLRLAGVEPRRIDALLEELGERTGGAGELEYFDIWAAIEDACAAAGVRGVSTESVRSALVLPAADHLKPLPGTRLLLECLRELGLRCVIASNGILRNEADYWVDFRAQGLDRLIHAIVSSVDTCWRKPHSRFFDVVLQAAGVSAEACMMIGNSETKDIAPAATLGMRTILVAIEEPGPITTSADALCGSLEDVAQAVRQLFNG
jgi:FMN phosphatase YigB (HAD superfamily)